jgi:hypothetical protein
LHISEDRYAISAGGRYAQGDLVVDGDEIAFFNSNACPLELPDGVGSYGWRISGEKLHLSPIEEDSCPERTSIVADRPFERAG